MTTGPDSIACRQFEARLPELIGSDEDLAADPHLQHCSHCRELLADLESIAAAARELSHGVEPPGRLWEEIEAALWSEGGSREPEESQE
jgi:predicted anti-sigma-YlaC factor YlaD